MNKKPTVFIYARRSSEKNRESSISIEKQKEELQYACEKRWFEVIGVFEDNKSAYTEWKRDEFSKMLEEVKNRNVRKKWQKVDYIYVYFISRLSRNFAEWDEIKTLVMNDSIKILSIKESTIDCSELDGKKNFVRILTDAIFDSLEKSIEALINMDKTYKRGWLARTLPYGYQQLWRKGNSYLILDERHNAAKAVRECFELYSTWRHTYDSLVVEFKKRGYKKYKIENWEEIITDFQRTHFQKILDNPFYWGKVVTRYIGLTEEKISYLRERYPDLQIHNGNYTYIDYTEILRQVGSHPRIIDKSLYDKCKLVQEKHTKWTRGWWHEDNEIYVWKWLMRCPCRDMEHPENYKDFRYFTAETKKKKVQRYQYYRCACNDKALCDNTFISGTALEKLLFEKIISKLVFNALELRLLEKVIRHELQKQWKLQEDTKQKLKIEVARLKTEKDVYMKKYGKEQDEEIAEELTKMIKKLKYEITDLENRLNNFDDVSEYNNEQVREPLRYAKELATGFLWFPERKKQHIAEVIFETIVVYKKEIVYFKLQPLFEGIYQRNVLTDGENGENMKNESSNSKNKKRKPLLTSDSDFVSNGGGSGIRTPAAPCGTLQV